MIDLYTSLMKIRRMVFTEVARLAYEGGDYAQLDELPYKILPGEVASYRESIFLERAIVGERLRLAIGLPLRPVDEHAPISKGIEGSAISQKYYDPPLINIIKFACNACAEKRVEVSNLCTGCLAHPCQEVCPKKCVHTVQGKSVIDQDECIKCGRCVTVCPYNAIVKTERPCAAACGVDAIGSDKLGRAEIDYDKCVSCGMCLVSCPFGAITDKGQIFQVIHAIKEVDTPVHAILAPSFAGQFGPKVTVGQIRAALRLLGFADSFEVAMGADLCAIDEAQDFLEKVPEELPFMGTSCCPAWSVMAKKRYPELASCISMALTPMVLTARLVKRWCPQCKIVFIGPCSAKKLEASRRSIRSDVDFVLTFEELMGMLEAKSIDPASLVGEEDFKDGATAAGRGFAVGGGVAKAVVDALKQMAPDREVQVATAQGLRECQKMLTLARAGKYDGYLLEGMACPGGCVAGVGTLLSLNRGTNSVKQYAEKSESASALDSRFKDNLDLLLEKDEQ